MLDLDLVYFEDSVTHFIGFKSLSKEGYIAARIINGILVLKHSAEKKDPAKYKYFIDLTQDTFIQFLRYYCKMKNLNGLQFNEVDGTFYEMYDGNNTQILRAIHFAKEQTRMELLTGKTSTHYLFYPNPIHDDSEEDEEDK